MFILILSFLLGGTLSFLGWFLNYCSVNYNVPFKGWAVFMFIAAVVIVVAGVIDFIVMLCRKFGDRQEKDNYREIGFGKIAPPKRNVSNNKKYKR